MVLGSLLRATSALVTTTATCSVSPSATPGQIRWLFGWPKVAGLRLEPRSLERGLTNALQEQPLDRVCGFPHCAWQGTWRGLDPGQSPCTSKSATETLRRNANE